MEQKTAMIAMSGGVDSSVAAWLAQQAGFACTGATLRLWDSDHDPATDAAIVAQRLGVPFSVFDHREDFRDFVVEPFISCYEQGLTPNPCIFCNNRIKFSVLLEQALALGCDCLVTGHYAQLQADPITGRYLLYKAPDSAKDQSYFLAGLSQHQLSHSFFPLGALTKEQVRTIAREQGFLNAKKKDSQDICFIPDGDYKAFMEAYCQKQYAPGKFLDLQGETVGTHSGAVGYTLGQRKGLGLAMGKPVYVCGKDMALNTVTVGPEEALFSRELTAAGWNWIPFPTLTESMRVTAKARSRHAGADATVYPEENGIARVVFDEPQRAITAGQAVVLYQGDLVIGSGTIQ